MGTQSNAKPFASVRLQVARLLAFASGLLGMCIAAAAPLTINVVGVGANGQPNGKVVKDYRWTVEEDATKASIPGRPADKSNYSFSFHTSYMPVISAGRVGTKTSGVTADPDVARLYAQQPPKVCPAPGEVCIDSSKRYYVSVAADGYQMGGAPVVFNGNSASATVYVNEYNLPTAQLSVFAFEDNNPINGAPDLPQEQGLAGFTVQLLEAGGTYGQSGGAVTQDAFGNPLGTTYKPGTNDVDKKGSGIILTGPDGTAVIKNLFPAKYTVVIVPPVGTDWHQTSTIEGGFGSDAWVKNNEPSFFQEFGPPGHHVFIGFVNSGKLFADSRSPRPNPTTPCAAGVNGCKPLDVLTGSNSITGRVVSTHHSRPPIYTFYSAAPVNDCWVGLNEANGGRALYAAPCTKESYFTIPNVPPGTYELVIWDTPLDIIISATTVTVADGDGEKALGNLPVSSWFARYQGRVFQDIDGTGLPVFKEAFNRPYIEVDPRTGIESEVTKSYAPGELKPPFGEGIANNIRFRDGSIYQSATTKQDGTFAFTELFPFFNWMVAEIDYARFKATGATMVVDEGGFVDPGANAVKLWSAEPGLFGSNDPKLAYDPWIRLNPQQQADGLFYRTENCANPDDPTVNGQCAILLEGMQTFLSQTNHIEWGKQPYGFNENGGIAGIVHYAITRAEDDPRFAAAENWEPGIPRVQVNLYLDCDGDGKPDQPANDGTGACKQFSSKNYAFDKPDVDNYPFCWTDPASCGLTKPVKGPEDIKRSASTAVDPDTNVPVFNTGDVFKWGAPGAAPDDQPVTGLSTTDSWDDSVPTGCYTPNQYSVPSTGEALDCYDGLRNFNQLRPSVFDGGYAFGRVAGQQELPMFIGTEGKGTYIVEAMAPPGYLHQGNGDKNVVFGDSLQASTAALPFACVGQELDVPAFLTLFPGEPNPNYDAGQRKWNKCDMKAVPLVPGTNPAPDFYMFTEAPVAGHGVGFILDDTATEFNQYAPTFGEKYSPPHLPVSVQDWTGREITRVYSDQFGSYNFLVPSSFTINPPFPSGVMPSMMVACMNHPGPVKVGVNADGTDKLDVDPFFNRNYTQFCYTLQYLPGKTTYLDTPVLPVSAFASVDKNPLDCECADKTPAIYSATNGNNGPWVPATGGTLTLISQGDVDVVNPAYDPTVLWPDPRTLPPVPGGPPRILAPGYSVATGANDPRLKKTIKRDYGFGGTPGKVTLGTTDLAVSGNWNNGLITVTIPPNTATGQQLTIRRGDTDGKASVVGITVHVGGNAPKKVNPNATPGSGVFNTIQAAIDATDTVAGDLITIAPGTYPEFVVLDKRLRLQGWGASSVTINASKPSAGGLIAWRTLIAKKIDPIADPTGAIDPDTGAVQLIPGGKRTFDVLPGQTLGFNQPNNEPILFSAEEAPGVMIVGRANSSGTGCLNTTGELRIDGITVTGSDSGGGILANGYACSLKISNNRVVANYGTYGGGIRIGHTVLENLTVDNNGNDVVNYTDAVNRSPDIHHNWVAQNGATEAGGAGGITLGTGSNGYAVTSNYICGNFSMADGGGLAHMGLSTGPNTISKNQFIFNQTFNQSADPTGAGLFIGGQIPLAGGVLTGTGAVNVDANLIQGNQAGAGAGGGVSIARTLVADSLVLTNNIIANNVSAYAGGGVSLLQIGATQSAVSSVRLTNNTVASNVSTATNRQSFGTNGVQEASLPQIAGIAILDDSPAPLLVNDIIWGNRSFVFTISGTTTALVDPETNGVAQYRDLGRRNELSIANNFAPLNSLLTSDAVVNNHVTIDASNQTEASTSTSLFEKAAHFTSITDPGQPVWLADATVALQSALTFDETGNFVNVIFTPLTLWEINGATAGKLRSDYHILANSKAQNNGQIPSASNSVPSRDYDGDTRPGFGNYDIGADELVPGAADLSITKTDGVPSVNRGDLVTYTITVSNAGPNPANGANVVDNMPATLTNVTWNCVGSAGATCGLASSAGSINTSVNLPAGGSATFTVKGTVPATTTATTLVNTATVTAPVTVSDPNPGNNSATDTDTITIPQPAFPTLTVRDNFNRNNANSLGSNWQQVTLAGFAGIRVNSNQAQYQLLSYATWNSTANGANPVFGSKQAAAMQLVGSTFLGEALVLKASGTYNSIGGYYPNNVRVRLTSTGQVVVETTNNDSLGLIYATAGTFAPSTAFVANDTLTAMVDSTGVAYVWKTTGTTNTYLGAVQLPTTGSNAFTLGSGRIGMYMGTSGDRADNFAGGTVP